MADNRQLLMITGVVGAIAAILVGMGEFLLHFDALGRYSAEAGYDFMLGIPDSRLTIGHFIGVLGTPLYVVGCWHIYLMLKPANKTWAGIASILGAYGFMVGAVWIGSRSSIASLVQPADASTHIQTLMNLYVLRYESLLTVIRVTTLILSLIFIGLALTGKTHYPRWMATLNPIQLIVVSFIIFALSPEIGKYLMPIALNVAFFIFFAASTWYASQLDFEQLKGNTK